MHTSQGKENKVYRDSLRSPEELLQNCLRRARPRCVQLRGIGRPHVIAPRSRSAQRPRAALQMASSSHKNCPPNMSIDGRHFEG